jgi:hypothetical protein
MGMHSIIAAPVGTAFTYQGKLGAAGAAANGCYDFQFLLCDARVAGNIVAGPVSADSISVFDGFFTASLDFGADAFGSQALWLEIAVRTNASGSFATLAPRQAITPSPFALYALSSGLVGDLSGQIVATNPANQFQGSFSGSLAGNGAGLTNLNLPANAITANQLASQSVSLTNLSLDNSLRIACAGIDAYGMDRFGWPHTLAKLATNGLLCLAIVGNGWAEDSDFGGFVTNLMTYKPLAGYASDVLLVLPSYLGFGPYSGMDTALYVAGDDTNWHGPYLVLTNTGSISAPVQILNSDICGVQYLANPDGGSLVMEIRTNGNWAYSFTNLDGTWTPVAGANASNMTWQGRTLWWTNAIPVETQIRVRATSPGWTPIVGYAQWNSTISNGLILCQYSHQNSANWVSNLDTNKVFPIWRAWRPDLVMVTGGIDDTYPTAAADMLALVRDGFEGADMVDVGGHLTSEGYTCNLERQYCFANGVPFFDGQAASLAAWGSYINGAELGLYRYNDDSHFTAAGYATFSQLLWSWMALTAESPAYRLAMAGNGLTTNLSIPGGATLCISNGRIWKVSSP